MVRVGIKWLQNRLSQGEVDTIALSDGLTPSTVDDLSSVTGNYDGELRLDDGTNTVARGTLCVWDDTNSVWRPSDAPSGSSFS